jgi:probable DNA repair protein
VYDWESWLSVLWHQRLQNIPDAPLLLTSLQERVVWKKIAGGFASDPDAIARLALNAWKLLSDFNAHGERGKSWGPGASDPEVFRGWASTFESECRSNRWLSRSNLTSMLAESIREKTIELPPEVLLLGFDRLTPAQQSLANSIRTAGTIVSELGSPPKATPLQLIQARDLRDELTICAWWLRKTLEENPWASVAVIGQGIDEMRGEIDRIFRAILMPGSAGVESNDAMPFEFSMGVPLADVPLVKAALLILRWLVGPLEQPSISWLMISGFLAASDEDLLDMARFDAELRERNRLAPATSLEAFLRYNPPRASPAVRQFRARLQALRLDAQSHRVNLRRRTFPEWISVAEALLRRLQWPGARPLESPEFQARARWERLTAEVAALGFDGARVGWAEFVTLLDRYAAETIFAPESRGAPIQIMGPLESAGQHFGALWFLGLDDLHWPPRGEPNQLLPLWLQRKARMPHATIGEDWALNLAITQRLASSAPECVFSHAVHDETGELRPSTLLNDALQSPPPACSSERLRASLQAPALPQHHRRTEPIEDASSIPWPREIPAGGAEVLKRQSACAFQSFAVSRLGAEELNASERGLTPRDRGNIVHDVMNAFWSKPNPQGTPMSTRSDLLNAKASGSLSGILNFHIAEVFRKRQAPGRDGEWSDAYLQIEQERLRSVLLRWLDYETTRTDFTVEACEKQCDANIDGLQLRLRVDRIDQVEGGRLILDYKTGEVSLAMWKSERPDEPQLPLYAVCGQIDSLRGVLFAQVHAGESFPVGRVEDAQKTVQRDLPKQSGLIKYPLDDGVLSEWTNALRNLADQFLAGEAAVAPKFYPNTCRYCSLASLCRVAETAVPIEAADESAAEENQRIEEDSIDD